MDALVRLWAPFLVYTCEEVWTHFSNDAEESVHYMSYPEVREYANAAELKETFAKLLDVRSDVNKALENARNEKLIASGQEAAVTLHLADDIQELFRGTLGDDVAQWLIVSKTDITAGEGEPEVTKAPGTKCPRCWNYSEEADEDGLCPRCRRVIKG